jgi:hypothetical protein
MKLQEAADRYADEMRLLRPGKVRINGTAIPSQVEWVICCDDVIVSLIRRESFTLDGKVSVSMVQSLANLYPFLLSDEGWQITHVIEAAPAFRHISIHRLSGNLDKRGIDDKGQKWLQVRPTEGESACSDCGAVVTMGYLSISTIEHPDCSFLCSGHFSVCCTIEHPCR